MMKSMLFSIIVVLCTISAVAQPPELDPPKDDDDLLPKPDKLEAFSDYMHNYMHNYFEDGTLSPSSFDQSCDSNALNDVAGCKDWGPWSLDTYKIYHPKYPDCPIMVNFTIRICNSDNNTFQINIVNFSMDAKSDECKGLKEYLEKEGALNQFEHDLFSLITRKIFVNTNLRLMNLPEGVRDTLFCTYPDGSPRENNVRVNFVKSSCKAYCYALYGIEGEGIGEILSYAPQVCQGSSCCLYSNEFCIDRKTNRIIQNETTVPIGNGSSNCDVQISNNDCRKLFPEGNGWFIISIGHTQCKPSCDLKPLYMNDPVIGK